MKRRDALALTAGAAALAAAPRAALAQPAWPTRSVRMVLGFPPGGQTDVIGRSLAQRLSTQLGQPVVVENRPGADSLIASQQVARAEPDGYTVYLASSAHAVNASLYRDKGGFDAVRDFTPVVLVGEVPNLVVIHPSVPARTLREFVEHAKTNKGQLNYATTASITYLSTELLNRTAGIEVVRVPYKGGGPAITALLSGEVQMMVSGIGPLLPHVRAGKLRALAVTGDRRSALAPEIPTVIEAGLPGYSAIVWYALLAPPRTPRAVVERLNAETNKALADAEWRNSLLGQGVEPKGGTPEDMGALLQSEVSKWERVVRDSGAKPE